MYNWNSEGEEREDEVKTMFIMTKSFSKWFKISSHIFKKHNKLPRRYTHKHPPPKENKTKTRSIMAEFVKTKGNKILRTVKENGYIAFIGATVRTEIKAKDWQISFRSEREIKIFSVKENWDNSHIILT